MEINISLILGTILNFAILIFGMFAIYRIIRYFVRRSRESKERLDKIEETLKRIEKKI
ncbi:hypothetical protein [Clostridium sp. UBA1652]|uniref:hypothetical protein n=1 Tax=Clostridium sp. UBA1652 TaxID=1946348 RepID=UPI00257BCF90|nr:hypothetical protein [Clostridium sp. UBA1652]